MSNLPPEFESAKRRLFESLDRLGTTTARLQAHADRLEHERRERERAERDRQESERLETQRQAALAQSEFEDRAEQAYRDSRRSGWLTSE